MSQNVFNRRQYTQRHHEALTTFQNLSSLGADTPHILIRVNTENIPEDGSVPEYYKHDDTDTFVMVTSAHPKDAMSYLSPQNVVDLNVRDGGYF